MIFKRIVCKLVHNRTCVHGLLHLRYVVHGNRFQSAYSGVIEIAHHCLCRSFVCSCRPELLSFWRGLMLCCDQVTTSFGEAVCDAAFICWKCCSHEVFARMGSTSCSFQASSSNRPARAIACYLGWKVGLSYLCFSLLSDSFYVRIVFPSWGWSPANPLTVIFYGNTVCVWNLEFIKMSNGIGRHWVRVIFVSGDIPKSSA